MHQYKAQYNITFITATSLSFINETINSLENCTRILLLFYSYTIMVQQTENEQKIKKAI